jgi:hypothetical protein
VRSVCAAIQPLLEKLLQKKKSRETGKAIIVLARKFLGIIYRSLKNKSLFGKHPMNPSGDRSHEA